MLINRELSDIILNHNIINIHEGFHGFIILLNNNKLWINDCGKFIFDSRKQAIKSFYNTMNWKCFRIYRTFNNPHGYGYYYRCPKEIWESFKESCEFKVIQI